MTEELTTKLSFRLNSTVYVALSKCAKDCGYETLAYIQKVLSKHAVESGCLGSHDAKKVRPCGQTGPGADAARAAWAVQH